MIKVFRFLAMYTIFCFRDTDIGTDTHETRLPRRNCHDP